MSKPTGCRCTDCGKVFGRKGDLNRHKRIHSGERPYVCTVCQKGFTQGTALKTHANIHTKKKPHKCGLGGCTAAFGDPSSCSRHRREKHNGIQGFRCPVPECRTQIKRRSSFVAHLRKHRIKTLSKEEITQMAIEPSLYELTPTGVISIHKTEEEEHISIPPAASYESGLISDEFGYIRSRPNHSPSDASGSPCSSPSSLASYSQDASSSSPSPGPQDAYLLTDGFPEYGSSFLPPAGSAPMQMHLEYSSSGYHDQVAVSVNYGAPFEPYVVDGYISTGSSSSSSSPSSSSPLPMPYVLDHYPGMSAMPEDCSGNALYEYQAASNAADWSHPPSGFPYVADDCPPSLGMRY